MKKHHQGNEALLAAALFLFVTAFFFTGVFQ